MHIISSAVLTFLIASTRRSMESYKDTNVYLPKYDDDNNYQQMRTVNLETGDFWEFESPNVVLQAQSYTDYTDPGISDRWYRKMEVSNSRASQIGDGLWSNAGKFLEEDKTADADPFAAHLVWEGKITSKDHSTNLIYLVFDHGADPLVTAHGIPEFLEFFSDPRNRMRFYIRLLVLLKRMVEKLNLRLCSFSPYGIGLVKSDEDGTVDYFPVYREFYNAVKLGGKCKSY